MTKTEFGTFLPLKLTGSDAHLQRLPKLGVQGCWQPEFMVSSNTAYFFPKPGYGLLSV